MWLSAWVERMTPKEQITPSHRVFFIVLFIKKYQIDYDIEKINRKLKLDKNRGFGLLFQGKEHKCEKRATKI
jgi:hypothetical protein